MATRGKLCGWSSIDELAVQWVVTERIKLPLNKAERLSVVAQLHHRVSERDLAELLDVTLRTIARLKAEAKKQQQDGLLP